RIFVEFGPKGVLTNWVKNILKGQDFQAVALNANARKNSDLQLRQAATQLRVIGVALNEIDIYKKPAKADAKVTKLNVKLGGHNYVSAPTKKAYTDVMNDGFRIQGGGTTVVEKPVIKEVEKVVERIVEVEKFVEVPVEKIIEKVIYQNNNEDDMNKDVVQLLQSTMEHFKNQQTKSLELFERFMSEQNQQSQQLLGMLSQQLGPVQNVLRNTPPSIGHTNGNGNGYTNGNGQAAIAENITPTFPPIVEEKVAKVVKPQPTIIVPTPAPVAVTQPTTGIDKSKLENILLTVISEKTGYPAEMLELSMDMEADLGIDSIKRVEIFGAMTEDYPEVNGINPNDLTELRTLGQIVDYLAGKTSDSVGSPQTAAAVSSSSSSQQSVAVSRPAPAAVCQPVTSNAEPTTGGVDKSKLEGILLTVISEKTGYPAEMLELSMDMEADLGIDSIKRVEIFGAMTEDYPEVNGINPNDLTELRTLGQIVDYLAGKTGDTVGSPQTAAAVSSSSQQSAAVSVPAPTAVSQPTTGGVDKSKLEGILLTVISEKTGYPAEMLELSMDMEADLGIDSIKRVEIFGAMTEDYPEVNGINPNDLTELRTLGQIVDYISQTGKKKILTEA
ncbi:MAG: phosphopantetheine-binding protein, partial [Saprospiraceae bacterium]